MRIESSKEGEKGYSIWEQLRAIAWEWPQAPKNGEKQPPKPKSGEKWGIWRRAVGAGGRTEHYGPSPTERLMVPGGWECSWLEKIQ